jgi:hypothetical protein
MTRADLHRLVDDTQDPVLARLQAAPLDDEPYTEEDRLASEEGWGAYLRGEAVKVP